MVTFDLQKITVADCLEIAKFLTAYDIAMTRRSDASTLSSRFVYHQVPPPYDISFKRWESHIQTVFNELEASVSDDSDVDVTVARIFMYIYEFLDYGSALLQPQGDTHIYVSHDETLAGLLEKYVVDLK